MTNNPFIVLALAAALLACGPAQNASDAQPAAGADASAQALSDADRTGVLAALQLRADAQGKVENECGEKVIPGLQLVDVGLGRTVLLAMEGGPNQATCYGDGPGLWLMQSSGSAWREIYSSRGGYMAILTTTHHGAHDLAFAGPGFSHDTYYFDGSSYTPSNQSIADEAMGNATVLP